MFVEWQVGIRSDDTPVLEDRQRYETIVFDTDSTRYLVDQGQIYLHLNRDRVSVAVDLNCLPRDCVFVPHSNGLWELTRGFRAVTCIVQTTNPFRGRCLVSPR